MTGLLAAILYGLFSIDHFAIGPFLVSRPLVLGGLVGGLFGRPVEGLTLGFVTESLWVMVPPAGPNQWDVGLATALSGVWVFSLVKPGTPLGGYFVVAYTTALLMAGAARPLDGWLRRNLRPLSEYARAGFSRGVSEPMWSGLLFSMALWGLKSLVVFFVAQTLGEIFCGTVFPYLTGSLFEGLDTAWRLWIYLGAAVLGHAFIKRLGKTPLAAGRRGLS